MNSIDMVNSMATAREPCCAIKGVGEGIKESIGATGSFRESFCVIDGKAHPGMSLDECTERKGIHYDDVTVFTGVSQGMCENYCSVKAGNEGCTVSGAVVEPNYVIYEDGAETQRRCNPMEKLKGGLQCLDKTAQDLKDATGANEVTRSGKRSLHLAGVQAEIAENLAPFRGYWYTRKNKIESSCVLNQKKCPQYISKEVQARAFRTSVLTIAAGCMIPLLLAYLLYTLFKR